MNNPTGASSTSVRYPSAPGTLEVAGLLAGPRTVLVPDPPSAVMEPAGQAIVVITGDSDAGPAEVIPVTGSELLVLDPANGAALRVAALRLATPSARAHDVPEFTAGRLAQVLIRNRGDVAATLRDLGYAIADGAAGIAGQEEQARPQLADDAPVRTLAEGLCSWLPCCGDQAVAGAQDGSPEQAE